ncbi:maleylpyruvate isomerase family mycothiol-dependent enzyme [Herbidospora sp. NEAU-GS84]|uniref:Maleylpyruvate isomerase family mycothiol-dependent enzyme n=1 Tax=Herbidospora solisilvae TaxID=2696284 RepID=A0A7C9N1B2_9ACTN|nr:maleylpyruvate isomerase family mycothiol-dependent enzyme [Herbidospora solisilvae]NAS26511.1 maleylpyruvate isomerase family mycothiol-dependent enzyme [Herbidospora solisilvae]
MSHIADRYAALADAFLDRIRATPAPLWDAKSPCNGWTARDVVAHVVNGHRGILGFVHGTPPAPAHGVGVSAMSDAPAVEPGADLGAAFAACRDDLLTVLRDPVLAARPLPFSQLGPVPVEHAVDVVGALELLGHTWDLARATGGDEALDREAVSRVHRALVPHHAALLATGAFDPSVAAPEDADAQTAFLCFTGRRP